MKKDEVTNFRYCTKDMYAGKTNFHVAVGNFDNIGQKEEAQNKQRT